MAMTLVRHRGGHMTAWLGCMAAWLPAVAAALPAPTHGVLQVTARIESGCRVVGQLAQAQTVEFGSLDFGSQPSIFAVPLTAQSQGPAGTLQLTCIGIVSANVAIGTGLHANGSQRQLASGANRVAYDLYADSNLSLPFDGAVPRSVAISPSGSAATVSLPIYGRIQPTPGGYAAGSYQDDVQVTVSW